MKDSAPSAEATHRHDRIQAITGRSGARVQRVPEGGSPPLAGVARGFIVENGPAGLGQMDRALFFARLRQELVPACNAELRDVDRTATDCPYIETWLAHYERQSIPHIERALSSYLGPGTRDAEGTIAAIVSRATVAIRAWKTTGGMSGIGSAVGSLAGAAGAAAGSMLGLQLKEDGGGGGGGGAKAAVDPSAVRAQLGGGRALDAGVRARMEHGFGRSFAGVRVHDDPAAAQLSSSLSARAFTVGQDVAFSSGQYRPGTAIGDLLIAHELAHTIQQGGAAYAEKNDGANEGPLEREADRAALGVIGSEYGLADPASVAQQGGLRIQRCKDNSSSSTSTATATPTVPRVETTPYGVYNIVADSTTPRTGNMLTQAEFTRLALAWTRVNDNSAGMRITGTPADRATMIAMFGREMGRSRTFRNLIIEITEDTARPVRMNVGRNNLGMGGFIDSWGSGNVDLNDHEFLEDTAPTGYEFMHGRGEAIIHWLAERRYGVTHPGTAFGPAHTSVMAPGATQPRYRADLGLPGRTAGQSGASPGPGLVDMIATDDSGNQTVFRYDISHVSRVPYAIEYRPAAPTAALPVLTRNNNVDAQVSATGGATEPLFVRFTTASGVVNTPDQNVVGGAAALHFTNPLRPLVPISGPITVELFRRGAGGAANTLLATISWNDPLTPATITSAVGGTSYNLSLRLVRS